MEDPRLNIKGLKESLGVTDEQLDHLRQLKVRTEMQQAIMMFNIWKRGGNLHGSDEVATQKRRQKNKAARKARKRNR